MPEWPPIRSPRSLVGRKVLLAMLQAGLVLVTQISRCFCMAAKNWDYDFSHANPLKRFHMVCLHVVSRLIRMQAWLG